MKLGEKIALAAVGGLGLTLGISAISRNTKANNRREDRQSRAIEENRFLLAQVEQRSTQRDNYLGLQFNRLSEFYGNNLVNIQQQIRNTYGVIGNVSRQVNYNRFLASQPRVINNQYVNHNQYYNNYYNQYQTYNNQYYNNTTYPSYYTQYNNQYVNNNAYNNFNNYNNYNTNHNVNQYSNNYNRLGGGGYGGYGYNYNAGYSYPLQYSA